MGWFAYQTKVGSWCSPEQGLAKDNLLPSGTFQIQLKSTDCVFGEPLLQFSGRDPWERTLSFRLDSRGNPELTIAIEGRPDCIIKSSIAYKTALTDMLITYAWDAPSRSGRLTVSNTGNFLGETVTIKNAPPLLKTDLLEMALTVPRTALTYVAVSDRPEPIGPMPGIDTLTLIDTPRGPVRAGELKSGDQIDTDLGVQTILARVHWAVPMAGAFTPIRLHAPFHGLKRHMTVAHHQGLVFGGADVEYAFGGSTVHIPAGLLETRRQPTPEWGLRTYCQFVLPKPAGIFAHGSILASMNIGRIRRRGDELPVSLLGAVPIALLPEHGDATRHDLPEFAARTLASGHLG